MADYTDFWTFFLKKAEITIPLYRGVKPKPKSWLNTTKGSFHNFTTAINSKKCHAWVEICFQKPSQDLNNQLFDHFFAQRNAIEQRYGGSIDWTKKTPEQQRSRIPTEFVDFDYEDEASWDKTVDELVANMSRFISAIESAAANIEKI